MNFRNGQQQRCPGSIPSAPAGQSLGSEDRETSAAFAPAPTDPMTQLMSVMFLSTLLGPWTLMAIGWSQRP